MLSFAQHRESIVIVKKQGFQTHRTTILAPLTCGGYVRYSDEGWGLQQQQFALHNTAMLQASRGDPEDV